jgi:hypothetical protein
MRASALGFVLVMAVGACGGGDENCAVPACVGGLSITVTSPPAEPYRLEVLVPGEATPQVRSCSGGNCAIFFHNLVAAQVTISLVLVSTGALVTSVNASPVYGGLFTSGACSVDCRTATVSL